LSKDLSKLEKTLPKVGDRSADTCEELEEQAYEKLIKEIIVKK